jgi:hypothetical protein
MASTLQTLRYVGKKITIERVGVEEEEREKASKQRRRKCHVPYLFDNIDSKVCHLSLQFKGISI